MIPNLPQWARKPDHKKTVIATPRGWMVKETGEYLKLVKDLKSRLEALQEEVSGYVDESEDTEIDADDQVDDENPDTGEDDIKSVDVVEREKVKETLHDPEPEKEVVSTDDGGDEIEKEKSDTVEKESDSETVNKVEQKEEPEQTPNNKKKRRGRPPKNKESQVNGTESKES